MRSIPASIAVAIWRRRPSEASAYRRRSVTRQSTASRAPGRFVMLPRREQQGEIREARVEIHEAETGDRASHEIVHRQRLEERPGLGEVVPLPERRPRQDDEE